MSSDTELQVSSRKALSDRAVTVVDVKGDLTEPTADQLTLALRRLLNAGRRKIVLNLVCAEVISSRGIAELVAAQKRLRERNGELKIAGATGDVWRVIETVWLHRMVDCHKEVKDAVKAFG